MNRLGRPAISVQKILIIGAPRSGTNMLRDLMVRLDRVGTWPCDEINHVWRHGNIRHPTDVLTPELARPEVKRYINERFSRLANSRGLDTVVEKTCANSLRVPFVERVIEDAKYVFIVRDGFDATVSASERWHAGLDLRYRLRKARFVPPSDVPYYFSRFVRNQLLRLGAAGKPLNSWGPVFDGMAQMQTQVSIVGICAHQWRACVEMAEEGLRGVPDERVHRVKYEDFVDDPVKEFRRVAAFAGKTVPRELEGSLRSDVSATSKGRSRSQLSEEDLAAVRSIIRPTLTAHGYL
jgi:hypothetical protein